MPRGQQIIENNSDFLLVNQAYPMFGANIRRLWGSKAYVTYTKELLAAASGAAGSGFPREVLHALERLAELHDDQYHDLLPHMDNNSDFKVINEAFPRIGAKLSLFWGRAEFGPYMSDLLHDKRGGNRQGFPFEVLMALHALAEKHNHDYRHLFSAVDIWTQNEI